MPEAPNPQINQDATSETPPIQTRPGFSKNLLTLVVIALIAVALYLGNVYYDRQIARPKNPELIENINLENTPEQINVPEFVQSPSVTRAALEPVATGAVNGKIAYSEKGDIYVIKADRTGKEMVLGDENYKYAINVSPDRKLIGYVYYPKNKTDEPHGGGNFGPPLAGVGLFNLTNKTNSIIVPYTDKKQTRAYYNLDFSPDGKYLSVWDSWGMKVLLVDTISGKVVLDYETQGQSGVSPFSFIPNQNLVSVILKNELFVINPQTKDINKIDTGLDAFRMRHEATSLPENPLYTSDGNFASYYKNSNLIIKNLRTDKETVIGAGVDGEMFGRYPSVFSQTFTSDNRYLVINGPDLSLTNLVNLDDYSIKRVASFGSTLVTSGNGRVIIGIAPSQSQYPKNAIGVYSLANGSYKECPPTEFEYNNSSWGGGPYVQPPLRVISPDNKALINSGEDNISVFNLDTCEKYYVVYGENISSPTWFP